MSESLKILFFTDSFLPAIDGVANSILSFKEELENRGNEVYIITVGNAETRKLAKTRKDLIVTRGMRFRRYPQYNLALAPYMTYLKLRKFKPNIVHVQTPFTVGLYGLLYSRINKYPVVGSFHTMFNSKSVIKHYLTSNDKLSKHLMNYSWKYLNYFYNKCDATIAPSKSIESFLSKKNIKNISLIPNGINLNNFGKGNYDEGLRSELADKDEKIVLYLGRISKEKNINVMIKAAKLLKDEKIKFIIGGTGPLEGYYKEMVNRYKLEKVKFVGFVDQKDLAKYYATADLLCLPSTFETQGIVSLEAMASGIPVVGAKYLALKDIIKPEKNGELFKPGDSKDCAIKIQKVINNIKSYNETRVTAEEYSIKASTDKLINLYSNLLNKPL